MEDLRGPFQSAESHAIAKVHLVGGAVARLAQALHMETV